MNQDIRYVNKPETKRKSEKRFGRLTSRRCSRLQSSFAYGVLFSAPPVTTSVWVPQMFSGTNSSYGPNFWLGVLVYYTSFRLLRPTDDYFTLVTSPTSVSTTATTLPDTTD
ncbi:hypothetical protein AAHE18_19G030300 [Arachis hypogaea]